MSILNLKVLIQAVDRATAPIRAISRQMSGLTRISKIASLGIANFTRGLRTMALAGTAAATAVTLGLLRMVQRTADAGDAAVKTAQKVGVGVEAWQRYAYAAQLADVGSEELADGLKYLNQSAAQAAAGAGGDAKAFAALGVSVRDASGELKPTGALFEEVATKIAGMKDGAEKTNAAMILMGRSGTNLIPLLNSGGDAIRKLGDDAQRMGLVIPEEQARQAEIFNDSITTLKASVQGLSNSVVGGLLPQLTQLIEKTTVWIGTNKAEVVAKMKEAMNQFSAALPSILEALGSLARLLGDIARAVAPLAKVMGGFGGVLNLLAGIMIGKFAVSIWMAVKAVMGLNAAMYANPIGLVIAAIGGLVFAGWMLYRNWDRVVSFIRRMWSGLVGKLQDAWTGIKRVFKAGVDAVWQVLPPWFRQVLRGVKFAVDIASNVPRLAPGLAQQQKDHQRSTGMYGMRRPALGPAPPAPALDAGGTIRLEVVEGRPTRIGARTNDGRMNFSIQRLGRGGYGVF